MKKIDEKIENFTGILEFMKKKFNDISRKKNKLYEIQILTNDCPNSLNTVVQEINYL